MLLRIRLLITTLWVGSGWTIGYLVAPTLFLSLANPMQAGDIAGKLFRVEAWLSVVCALVLLLLLTLVKRHGASGQYGAPTGVQIRTQMQLILAMLACTLIGYFGLQPLMAILRETTLMGEDGIRSPMIGAVKMQFGLLHGVASLLYLVQSLLGAALIWKEK